MTLGHPPPACDRLAAISTVSRSRTTLAGSDEGKLPATRICP